MAAVVSLRLGPYALYDAIGAGSTSTVHLALVERDGYSRLVAVKRFGSGFSTSADFVKELTAETTSLGNVRHLNIVPIDEVVADDGECLAIMAYTPGATLAALLEKGSPAPPAVAVTITRDVLRGLQAVHEARDPSGDSLGAAHGDVSPGNVLVGADGFTRVLDFGVARAVGDMARLSLDRLRAKVSYMAPERLEHGAFDAGCDLFSVGVTMWEMLTGRRLFLGDDGRTTMENVRTLHVQPPSDLVPGVPPELDAVVLRALERDPANRFASASEMVTALTAALKAAPPNDVDAWVKAGASEALAAEAALAREIQEIGRNAGAESQSYYQPQPEGEPANPLPMSGLASANPEPDPSSAMGQSFSPAVSSHADAALPFAATALAHDAPAASFDAPMASAVGRVPSVKPPASTVASASFGSSPNSFAPASFGAPSHTASAIAASAIKELPPPMPDRKPTMHGPRKILLGAVVLASMYGAVYYLLFMQPSHDPAMAEPMVSASSSVPIPPASDPFEQLAKPIPADSSSGAAASPHLNGKGHGKPTKHCNPPYVKNMSGRLVPNPACN